MPAAFLHKNKPLAIVLTMVYVLVFRIGNFLAPLPVNHAQGQLYDFLQADRWPLLLQTGIGLALVFISGILLDMLVTRFGFLGKISGYPFVCFGIFASLHPLLGGLDPALVALPFLLLGFWALVINYGEKQGQISAFAVGAAFAMAALIYPPFLFFLLFGLAALASMKPASWKEYFSLAIGFGIPHYFFYAILYLLDIPAKPFAKTGYHDMVHFFAGFSFSWSFWMTVIFCFSIIFLGLLNVLNTYNTYKIITRRFFNIVLLLPLFLLPAAFVPILPEVDAWWPMVITFSVLTGRLFLDIKKISYLRLILVLAILVSILVRLDYYFGETFTFKLVN